MAPGQFSTRVYILRYTGVLHWNPNIQVLFSHRVVLSIYSMSTLNYTSIYIKKENDDLLMFSNIKKHLYSFKPRKPIQVMLYHITCS